MALHPSGLFILVGFSEKLRLMNLLIDDIRPFKEFLIRGCKEVRIEILSVSLCYAFSLCHSVPLPMEVTCLLQPIQISFSSSTLTHLRISAI